MNDPLQQISAWAAALVAATDQKQVFQIWQTIPRSQEEPVLDAVAQFVIDLAKAGNAEGASRAQIWYAELRQFHRERDEHPPYVAAIQAFLQAADEAAARRVFAARQVVLQPYEAQVWLDRRLADATEEERTHLTARAVLLRTLRGVAPVAPVVVVVPPAPIASTLITTVHGNLNQAGGNIYQHSVHIEVSDHGMFINNMVVEPRWQRPSPPPLLWDTISRTHDLQQVKRLLGDRGQVAISGPTAAAVQGMPGIGKTTLARQLARDLDAYYPDGVLWQEIGPQISADQVQRILNQWAQMAIVLPSPFESTIQFRPEQVRSLLQDRHLLVILDDVWSLDVIRPLREALPDGAHLILTTRLETVTVGLGGGRHVLGVLSPEEARALIALRLPAIPADHQGWCDALAQGVGYHTLALDVALGVLRLEGDRPEDWQQTAAQVVAALRTGQGFDDLQIPDGDREQHVERVLAYSYERMDAVAQERFRLLGALAEEVSWATAHIAQLWQCDEQTARRQLNALVNAALLSRTEQNDRWQQHSLLRGYALALLHRAGTAEAASAQHAAIYDAAMQQADAAQQYHTMLPDYPQLRHAVAWAIANDLARVQRLISNAANLQAAFGLGREGLIWSLQAREVVQQRGTPEEQARAQVTLGNALWRGASLSSEDRANYLYTALAAYDEALRFYHPNIAPFAFAMTQTGRGIVLCALASLLCEDRAGHLHAALAAYDEALRFYRPDTDPLALAVVQNNRGIVLHEMASLHGEDRADQLRAALEAYNEALRFRRPNTTPLDFAGTQTNRGAILRDLASLPGEDQAGCLHAALAAYDEALCFYRPDTTPLDFAGTQTNRGTVLSNLASLHGEDRTGCLHAALAAYDEALRFYHPNITPFAFAATQTNRGAVFCEMASLPDADRVGCLRAALAACDEALRFFYPNIAPLDFAKTQYNRGVALHEMANLPGEDRVGYLRAALAAYDEALRFRHPNNIPFDFAGTQANRGNVLSDLANVPDENRDTHLYAALDAYNEALRFFHPDISPFNFARTQGNLGMLLCQVAELPTENPHNRHRASLQALWSAFTTFTTLGHARYQQLAATQICRKQIVCGQDFLRYWNELQLGSLPRWLKCDTHLLNTETPMLSTFLAGSTLEDLNTFWQQIPRAEKVPFLELVAQTIAQAIHAENNTLATQLSARLEELYASQQRLFTLFQARAEAYNARFDVVKNGDSPSTVWQEVISAGEQLLEPSFAGMEDINWTELDIDLSTSYYYLGRALHREGSVQSAVEAYNRALQLQPAWAPCLCSRLAALITLGNLDAAAVDLAQARALEPNAPDLAALDARLTQARLRQNGGS